MKNLLIAAMLFAVAAAPAAAQGKGNGKNKVPPGHLPAAGECRVWYDGVPPGRQPAPTRNCDEAERIASRDRNARVLYGSDARRNGTWSNDPWDPRDERIRRDDGRRRNGNGQVTGRAVPRGQQYPGGGVYDDRRYNTNSVAYRQGYQDGVEKAREDTRDGDAFDPARHGWYKSADRGYNSRYGAKDQYREEYRDAFLEGYRAEYRGRNTSSNSRWWPF